MTRSPIYPLRLDPERRTRWEAAAAARNMRLSEWIKLTCDAALDAPVAPETVVLPEVEIQKQRSA